VALEQREGHGEKLERATLRELAERVADTEGAVLCGGDFVQVLDDRVGRLLEQRGNPPDVAVSAIDPTGAGAPVVVEDEVVRQRGTDAVEVVVDQRTSELEESSRSPARGIAAGRAIEQLHAGGAATVGVEPDDRDDPSFGVDLGEVEGVDLER